MKTIMWQCDGGLVIRGQEFLDKELFRALEFYADGGEFLQYHEWKVAGDLDKTSPEYSICVKWNICNGEEIVGEGDASFTCPNIMIEYIANVKKDLPLY